jgi:hypothetical protein
MPPTAQLAAPPLSPLTAPLAPKLGNINVIVGSLGTPSLVGFIDV